MGSFAWTEAMSVGVPALDADHRCLVRIINLLEHAEGNDVRRVIDIVMDTLDVYCRYHFAREEKVMASCGFPALAFHRREHNGFCRAIARMAKPDADAADAKELLEFLKTWLLHHILIQDMAYKPYVASTPHVEEMTPGFARISPHGDQHQGAEVSG